jgi:predicted DNA-binding transcriptional regulator YafY
MRNESTNRLSRLTAILTQLQTKRIVTATTLSNKFSVSIRTIYRDIRSLEEAGVPIVTEDGRGYSLMDGYRVSPLMFTEAEANALVSAEKIIHSSNDESLIKEFLSAIEKIKAVIPNRIKEKTEALESKLGVVKAYTQNKTKSKHLLDIQKALIEHWVLKIKYVNLANNQSEREIEPFAIYSNENDDWVVVAYCRMRNEFRAFLLNRMQALQITHDKFEPHPITLSQYKKKFLKAKHP